MIPAARACAISALICASEGAPAATCRPPTPDAAGRRSGLDPPWPLTSRAAPGDDGGGSGSPPPVEPAGAPRARAAAPLAARVPPAPGAAAVSRLARTFLVPDGAAVLRAVPAPHADTSTPAR